MKKKTEKDITKLHDLVLKKLDKMMMSIEDSKEWKKVKNDYGFTLVMSEVIEECLYRWLDNGCIHEVKDALNDKLERITSYKVIKAKEDREEARLN